MPRPTLSAILAGILLTAGPAAAADPPVTGKFTGNGKEAKLQFVSTKKGEPYLDKPTTVLIFTEKDHSKDKRPEFAAGFGDYGSALILTVKEDGKIIGCVVAHSAHEKKGFNSLGSIALSDFKKADGSLTGRVKTNGVVNTFGEKWEVDLKFEAKAP